MIKKMLKTVSDSLKKILNSQAKADIELGYINEEGLKRGINSFYILANFIEQHPKLGDEFREYRKARVEELKKEQEEAEE